MSLPHRTTAGPAGTPTKPAFKRQIPKHVFLQFKSERLVDFFSPPVPQIGGGSVVARYKRIPGGKGLFIACLGYAVGANLFIRK